MLVLLHPENQRRAPLYEYNPNIKTMTRRQAYRVRNILEHLSLWLIIIAIGIGLVALVWSLFE